MFSYKGTNATKGDYQVNKHALPKNLINLILFSRRSLQKVYLVEVRSP